MSSQVDSDDGASSVPGQASGRGGRRGRGESRGRRSRRQELPFLLGGSKTDPLNLANVNADTPIHPLVVEIPDPPKNKRDPLNLNSLPKLGHKNKKRKNGDDFSFNYDEVIVSPVAKPSRPKHKRQSSETHSPKVENSADSIERQKQEQATQVPQSSEEDEVQKQRQQKKEYFNSKYSLGNFDRYYGRRIESGEKDPRLLLFKKEWFEKKAILDIGCNAGFLTLSIAKDFEPRRILGIDIDQHLVGVARKNIRHYCDSSTQLNGKFPVSFSSNFGPVANTSLSFSTKFPDNVWFRYEDYVLENDELLETVQEEFDVILALSITKWIHLNRGDDGLRRFFKRVYRHLRPGGVFILEPQAYESYWKRAKMTPNLKETYKTIEFKPDEFELYLTDIIGFYRVEHLGVPKALSKGYARPLDVYHKKPLQCLEKKEMTSPSTADQSSSRTS